MKPGNRVIAVAVTAFALLFGAPFSDPMAQPGGKMPHGQATMMPGQGLAGGPGMMGGHHIMGQQGMMSGPGREKA